MFVKFINKKFCPFCVRPSKSVFLNGVFLFFVGIVDVVFKVNYGCEELCFFECVV